MANVKELVRRSQTKDQQAFAELVSLYQDKVYSLSYHLTGDATEAQDLAQEVFLRAYLHIGTFRQEADFGTWLHRITVNVWLNSRRKQKGPLVISLDTPIVTEDGEVAREVAAAQPDPLEMTTERELQQLVRRALQELPADFRAVLVLREIEGYNYEEIARLLRCSLGTVKSRLNRARHALKAKVLALAARDGYSLSDR
ncbi:MAG: sigma-70 family RNA polymerase sigma factor [Clostridia bacterium]|nr:sigma-70 family RNA polymerase sigma factor [Clostridia bacterium]